MNRIAIVLDGHVLSSPTLLDGSFPDPVVDITGSFTRAETRAIVKKINQAGRLR